MERLKKGKITGVPNNDGDVVPGIVMQQKNLFGFVEVGRVAEVSWVDTGSYETAVPIGVAVQPALPHMDGAIYERIQLNSRDVADRGLRGSPLAKSLRAQRVKIFLGVK